MYCSYSMLCQAEDVQPEGAPLAPGFCVRIGREVVPRAQVVMDGSACKQALKVP